MERPYFFGYGSLVNRATHDYPNAAPARIRGWRRAWRHAPVRAVSFLTVIPSPEAEIDGLVAEVPGHDWTALDARERAYDRLPVTGSVRHSLDFPAQIAVYAIPGDRHGMPGPENPVLLSYLDTVVQGYRREFGDRGVEEFFATTDGWEAPILDDRAAPRYPRHQPTTREERALVDDHLSTLSACVEQL